MPVDLPSNDARPDDVDRFKEATHARDPRFDGLFVFGTRSTGIYCRPVCTERRGENVEIFRDSLQAEAAGFRPCSKCRPEDAPLRPGGSPLELVRRSLETTRTGKTPGDVAGSFARTLNMTIDEAHRWFEVQTGLSLDAVIGQCRVDFARKLVVETNLTIETISGLAACPGVREFEEAFAQRFRQSPGTLREDRIQEGSTIRLTLPYRPPLDWQGVLNFARYHQIQGLEAVDEVSYRRFFTIGKAQGLFRVTNDPKKPQLNLELEVDDPAIIFTIIQRVRRMFDLDCDLLAIGECFGKHEILGPLWNSRPGLRIARGWDPFETAVLTILGQLVSTRQARALVGQLVEACGTRSTNPIAEDIPYLFPDAETLANADLAPIRTSPARKRAIQELSRAIVSGEIDLDDIRDIQGVKERLLGLAGIGPWTAEYIGLRALGDPDSFPRTDLVIKRAFERHTGLDLDGVRPWRGYVAVCLWSHFAKPASP